MLHAAVIQDQWSTGSVFITGQEEFFHFGPMYGTNNIGEFLAIVHGLALMKQKGINMLFILIAAMR